MNNNEEYHNMLRSWDTYQSFEDIHSEILKSTMTPEETMVFIYKQMAQMSQTRLYNIKSCFELFLKDNNYKSEVPKQKRKER